MGIRELALASAPEANTGTFGVKKVHNMESKTSYGGARPKEKKQPAEKAPAGFGAFLSDIKNCFTKDDTRLLMTALEFKPAERDKVERSEDPCLLFVRSLKKQGMISRTDISLLIEKLHKCGLHGVAEDVDESFRRYKSRKKSQTSGPLEHEEGYSQFLLELESLIGSHSQKLATWFGYTPEVIDIISNTDTPGHVFVQAIDDRGEISPTDISKLIKALEHEIVGLGGVARKVKEAFGSRESRITSTSAADGISNLEPTIPTLTPVTTGYAQFRLKLESLLTREHAYKLAASFEYDAEKIENISESDNPTRGFVQLMDERGEIGPTDISKLITAMENEIEQGDVVVKVREAFELYGKFYEQFLLTLESLFTRPQAVSIAECFEYPPKKIDSIRKSDKPGRLLVQLMNEGDDITPTNIFKFISVLKHESVGLGDVVDKVNEAFDLQQKKTQFRKELREKYKNLCGGILPVPFLREKYDIEELFVESRMEFLEDKHGVGEVKAKWKEIQNHKMIFTDPQIKSKRRIIDGEPGYGKSTLALQITRDWCKGIAPMKDFELLILLRLRQLRNVKDVYAAIKKFLLPRDSKLTPADMVNILNSSFTIILLDGYDEYPDRGKNETDIDYIIKGDMFQNQEVVLMTRTSCLPQDHSYDTKRIRLTGFDDTVRFTYILNVVARGDSVKAEEIKQLIEKNQAASDLCKVPMFCVMISHMVQEHKTFQDLKTVTKFFSRVVACFHSHEQRRTEAKRTKGKGKRGHSKLNRIAFEALKGDTTNITWDEDDLRDKIGDDLYDEYVSIGILREEEVFDDETSDYVIETRFFHKLFTEWYAAHYLAEEAEHLTSADAEPTSNTKDQTLDTSNSQSAYSDYVRLLSSLDPIDVHYTYRFACGLNSNAALKIIKYLGENEVFDLYTLMCITEWMSKWGCNIEPITETATALCSRGFHLDGRYNGSLILQTSTVQLIEFASSRKVIPIKSLTLDNCLNVGCQGNLRVMPSYLYLPVINAILNYFRINDEGREITEEETNTILQYLAKCPGLKRVWFQYCLLPRYIEVTESMSVLKSRGVKVVWWSGLNRYLLDLDSGRWMDRWLPRPYLAALDGATPMTDEQYQLAVEETHKWREVRRKRLEEG
ncbi:NLR family CARD domain-containing protein 4 [Holothuria leucospilota]|uniref:NLR family CARD domain-containing protein 4 n=1 Tax=Holothuria leucospilota TaxID=206669 RepID=A0A9Q1HL07_HOLLE|nr:NLR family CARD domain-containing protein 4 [Holothuria leucospilota]